MKTIKQLKKEIKIQIDWCKKNKLSKEYELGLCDLGHLRFQLQTLNDVLKVFRDWVVLTGLEEAGFHKKINYFEKKIQGK